MCSAAVAGPCGAERSRGEQSGARAPGVRAAPAEPGCGRPERSAQLRGRLRAHRGRGKAPPAAPPGPNPNASPGSPTAHRPGCCHSPTSEPRPSPRDRAAAVASLCAQQDETGSGCRESQARDVPCPPPPPPARGAAPGVQPPPAAPGAAAAARHSLALPPRPGSGDAPPLPPCPPPPAPSFPARRSGAEGAQRQRCGAVGAAGSARRAPGPAAPEPRSRRRQPPAPLPSPAGTERQPTSARCGAAPPPEPCNLPRASPRKPPHQPAVLRLDAGTAERPSA